MKYGIIGLVALLAACSAEFTDLRPPEARSNTSVGSNSDPDAGFDPNTDPDGGATTDSDAGRIDQTDAGTAEPDSGGNTDPGAETLIATGDFTNVAYDTVGSAQYWQLADGTYEVRLSPDFVVSGVPGPAIAVSPRNPLDGRIDSDELDIGALTSNSGPHAYALPGNPADFGFVWIWCKPFGLDVAFAEMEFQ
jgi:hypothetical protein